MRLRKNPIASFFQDSSDLVINISSAAFFANTNADHGNNMLLCVAAIDDAISLTGDTLGAVAGQFIRKGIALFVRFVPQTDERFSMSF